MSLTFQDKATQEELKLIAHARPHVAIEDYNGNFLLIRIGTRSRGNILVQLQVGQQWEI